MGSIKVIIDDEVDRKFRRVAMKKFGYRRGALSEAAETALEEWSSKEDLDEATAKGIGDPVSAIEGLLKHVNESAPKLQHDASKIRARRFHGKSSN